MFMESFTTAHQELFLGAGEEVALAKGRYLLRRGDPGGDVYLIRSGQLEVVDRRATPEVVLAVVEEGSVVGELAFIDDSPRSADVRAGGDCRVVRWARDDLRSLLQRHPDFAAQFYETISRVAAHRIRSLSDGAVASASGRDEVAADADLLRGRVAELVEPLKRELPGLEKALKRDADDPLAIGRLIELLEGLQEHVQVLFDALEDRRAAAFCAELLGREMHPWLSRSFLAERCLARPHGASGSAEILAHLLLDRSGGDGPLGDHLDRWLLDRPSFRALRLLRDPLVERVASFLPRHRNRRVLIVNAGTGSLVARMSDAVVERPTIITVIDQSRDALSFLDAGMVQRREGVALETVQENLAGLAIGRARNDLPPFDAVVLHGLLEYMPERIAVSMLREARTWLAPDGVVVTASLTPSPDRRFVDRLLRWPTIRRTEQETRDLFTAAQLSVIDLDSPEPPALLAVAGMEDDTMLKPDMETEIRPRPA